MKKLTLKSKEGCWRLLAIFIIILLLSGLLARAFQNDFGKVKVEQVSFDSRGAILNAELYYPVGTSDKDSLPGIVVTHGGGCTLGVTKGIASELARRGFVVLNVSAYGTGLSDQPIYDEAGQGVDGFDMNLAVNGLYDALCYMKSLEFVDSTRIGSVGHSMGAVRTFAAAALDAGYLSVNDQMLNTLYEVFGVEISAEQINYDADTIAEEMLNADQLIYYYAIKESVEETYSTSIKAEVALGKKPAGFVMDKTVTVAGHEVVRSIQTNFAFVTGEYDPTFWGFTDDENARAGWNAYDGFNDGDWYSINDADNTNVNLGSFGTESIINNTELADAIENRTTRALLCTGAETHSKEVFSSGAIEVLVNYFSQTLNYNNGNLTDAGTQTISADNQIWMFRAAFNFVSMLAMFGVIISLGALLLKHRAFAVCVSEVRTVRPKLSKAAYLSISLLTVIFGFASIYLANKNGLFFFNQSKFLPLGRGAVLTVYFLFAMAIASVIIVGVSAVLNKKGGADYGFTNLNIKVPIKSVAKSLIFSLLLIIVGYACLSVSEYLFGQNFSLWMNSLSDMKVEWWTLGLNYAILLFPLYFVLSVAVNFIVRTDIPEWKDTLITVLINSGGVWLCCLLNYLIMRASYDGTQFSDFTNSYQFIIWVPLTTYISRKMYNLTKNVWSGAMINTFIIVWAMVSTLGVNDTYWGPNWISNFFNI